MYMTIALRIRDDESSATLFVDVPSATSDASENQPTTNASSSIRRARSSMRGATRSRPTSPRAPTRRSRLRSAVLSSRWWPRATSSRRRSCSSTPIRHRQNLHNDVVRHVPDRQRPACRALGRSRQDRAARSGRPRAVRHGTHRMASSLTTRAAKPSRAVRLLTGVPDRGTHAGLRCATSLQLPAVRRCLSFCRSAGTRRSRPARERDALV